MKLNIKDRIYIPALLPQEGSFMEFNLKREILKKVVITENDKAKYEIVEDREAGQIKWNNKKDAEEPLCVDFSSQEIEYLKKACEAASTSKYPDDFWFTVEKIYNAANQIQ